MTNRRVFLAVRISVTLLQDFDYLRMRVRLITSGQQVKDHLPAMLMEDDVLQVFGHFRQNNFVNELRVV